MPQHDIVVIGASAGGLQALSTIVQALPPTLPASVVIVMHAPSNGQGILPQIVARISALPVAFAADGDVLEHGRIYIARPDAHLILGPRSLAVAHGPRENGFRPAVDPLFRTAARQHGPRVIGVVLSGALSDGTYGLSMIKHCGGIAVVQQPEDAIIPGMPLSAIRHVDVDHVLPATEIGPLLERLTRRSARKKKRSDMPHVKDPEPQLPSQQTGVGDMKERFGLPSALTCPDCGGALWEVRHDRVVRYQCHVGHQYAPENLDAGQRDAVDGALWSALRVLEEHVDLKTRMSDRAAEGGLTVASEGFAEGARDARWQAQRIRDVLFKSPDTAMPTSAARARKAAPVRKHKNASR